MVKPTNNPRLRSNRIQPALSTKNAIAPLRQPESAKNRKSTELPSQLCFVSISTRGSKMTSIAYPLKRAIISFLCMRKVWQVIMRAAIF